MADAIDMANDIAELHLQTSLRAARQPVPKGVAGECETCFEESLRLIGGRCAPCRDGRRR